MERHAAVPFPHQTRPGTCAGGLSCIDFFRVLYLEADRLCAYRDFCVYLVCIFLDEGYEHCRQSYEVIVCYERFPGDRGWTVSPGGSFGAPDKEMASPSTGEKRRFQAPRVLPKQVDLCWEACYDITSEKKARNNAVSMVK